MATKTDRILAVLPGTFRPAPPSALHAIADAVGSELLLAENALVSVLRAHWVDQADREASEIDDLARLAALYGLAPRPDEEVEEFREHLKRYVRTFLEGTVTVQGALRLAAEALGLRIRDDHEELDAWWRRPREELVETRARPQDAAGALGLAGATAAGVDARRAEVRGTMDLRPTIDVTGASVLRLRVDDGATLEMDLAAGAADPTAATPEEIVGAIEAVAPGIARDDGGFLVLASPTPAEGGRLEVPAGADDAAQRVLGVAPRSATGSDAAPGQVTGAADLSGGAELSRDRFLRVAVDGDLVAEVDCADPADPAHTGLDHVRDAIDAALPGVASHDGRFLVLTSPTTGAQSSVAIQAAAAQDAAPALLGDVPRFGLGRDAAPARIAGTRDLSGGVDLRERSVLRIGIDGDAPVAVPCAGADPEHTRPAEITAAVNAALGGPVASHDGRLITLSSPSTGGAALLVLDEGPDDAAEPILGLSPRSATGAAATRARVVGTADLPGGVEIASRQLLSVRLDRGPAAVVDLRSHASDAASASLEEIVAALDAALGTGVAGADGSRLTLTSATSGTAGHVAVEPVVEVVRRHFVTRAAISDDATFAVLGFLAREAQGAAAQPARLVGEPDLSRTVDLRGGSHLRLSVDAGAPVEVDCAGAQPRATRIEEVVDAIRTADPGLADVAGDDGRHLVLTSPTAGVGSRVVVEPSLAQDALAILGFEPGTVTGLDGARVALVGTVDLSAGVDLAEGAGLSLGVDGADPVEIPLAGEPPHHRTLGELVTAINTTLDAMVAASDGERLRLTSPTRGRAGALVFEAPAGADATAAVIGFPSPRSYSGEDARAARLRGRDLPPGLDLRTTRRLRVAVDGAPAVEVDCAAHAADPAAASPAEILAALEAALPAGVAVLDGSTIVLTSPTAGPSGRLALAPAVGGDARVALLGTADMDASGTPPAPATLTGEADLLLPVDLSARPRMRLIIDGGQPIDVDVAGPVPAITVLAEIVAALNSAVPGLAAATDDSHLRLTSPSAGEESRVEVVPLRTLDVAEYPPQQATAGPASLRHGEALALTAAGVADSSQARVTISAPHGSWGPGLVDLATGWELRLLDVLAPGERVELAANPALGVAARIAGADDAWRPVSPGRVRSGLGGSQASVPYAGVRWAARTARGDSALELSDPLEPSLVVLRVREPRAVPDPLAVEVRAAAELTASAPEPAGAPVRLTGALRRAADGLRLDGAGGMELARVIAGAVGRLAELEGRVVAVRGPLYPGAPPVLLAQEIAALYDVRLAAGAIAERFEGVTIGARQPVSAALALEVATRPSALAAAQELPRARALAVRRGRSERRMRDCEASRFDSARFDSARFAGGSCVDRAMFDVSRFTAVPADGFESVFADGGAAPATPVDVTLTWTDHRAGAFRVELPADLSARFGARFDAGRFSLPAGEGERYEDAVTEPPDHPDWLVTLVEARQGLVRAAPADAVPLGWAPVSIPFRKPRRLELGTASQTARIYLSEAGVPGFIRLEARSPGTWGNDITVVARTAGPARFDVEVALEAARFDSAREAVLGGPLPGSTEDLLRPSPVGVRQGKAAGVHVGAVRDRTAEQPPHIVE